MGDGPLPPPRRSRQGVGRRGGRRRVRRPLRPSGHLRPRAGAGTDRVLRNRLCGHPGRVRRGRTRTRCGRREAAPPQGCSPGGKLCRPSRRRWPRVPRGGGRGRGGRLRGELEHVRRVREGRRRTRRDRPGPRRHRRGRRSHPAAPRPAGGTGRQPLVPGGQVRRVRVLLIGLLGRRLHHGRDAALGLRGWRGGRRGGRSSPHPGGRLRREVPRRPGPVLDRRSGGGGGAGPVAGPGSPLGPPRPVRGSERVGHLPQRRHLELGIHIHVLQVVVLPELAGLDGGPDRPGPLRRPGGWCTRWRRERQRLATGGFLPPLPHRTPALGAGRGIGGAAGGIRPPFHRV